MNSSPTLCRSLELSWRILELMKQAAWEEAAALGTERLQVMRQEFTADPGQEIQERMAQLLEIEALNREIKRIGLHGKAQLSEQLRQLRQGLKAGKAYAQNRN